MLSKIARLLLHGAAPAVAMTATLLAGGGAAAQDFPARTVRIITNSSPGGTFDVFARALAADLQARWGQPVIVEPRPGGNFMISGRVCAEAEPDGHTLCAVSGETLVYGEFLYKTVPYNARTAFTPITNLFFNTQVLISNVETGIRTLKDIPGVSKQRPLAFSAPAIAQRQLLEKYFKESGADVVTVPFRGGGEALTSVLNGSVPLLISGGSNFRPLIDDNKVFGVAVDSPQRTQLFKDVATFAEQGFTTPMGRNYLSLVAPAGVSKAIVDKVNRDVRAVMAAPSFRDVSIVRRGLEPNDGTPEQLAEFLETDRAGFAKMAKDTNIELQ